MAKYNQRQVVRNIHIVGGMIVGTYIYSPWGSIDWFASATKFGVIPGLVLSGLWLWKGHLLRKKKNARPIGSKT